MINIPPPSASLISSSIASSIASSNSSNLKQTQWWSDCMMYLCLISKDHLYKVDTRACLCPHPTHMWRSWLMSSLNRRKKRKQESLGLFCPVKLKQEDGRIHKADTRSALENCCHVSSEKGPRKSQKQVLTNSQIFQCFHLGHYKASENQFMLSKSYQLMVFPMGVHRLGQYQHVR